MGEFTRLGCSLWYWEGFVDLNYQARNLWLGLYTSGEAKRICPGLWHGGIGSMANAAKMRNDEVLESLDDLLARGLVEYEQRKSVLRLTKLPDTGERAFNGNAIRGWWNRFSTVPACDIRNRHVKTLLWLVEGGKVTADHREAWADTFHKIPIPPEPSRIARLIDSDTSTRTQPGLFGAPVLNPPDLIKSGISKRLPEPFQTETETETDLGIGIPEGENGLRGDRVLSGAAPRLTLLPPAVPFSAVEMCAALGLPVAGLNEVVRAIADLDGIVFEIGDLEILRVWATRFTLRDRIAFVEQPGHLASAFSRARHWHTEREAELEKASDLSRALAEARQLAGV